MSLELRAATSEDLEVTHAIKRAAFREYVQMAWGWDEDVQWRRHQERFAEQDVRMLVWDGEDVGFASLELMPDHLALHQLFIQPERQGQGIGEAFMRFTIDEARNLGLPLRLQVLKVNPRALAFYLRLGFTKVGESATHDQLQWL